MVILTEPQTTLSPWYQAISQPAKEFAPTPLKIISGELPEGLSGSLYSNSPGRLERGGQRVGHWFDGDGAILAVHFHKQGATGVYRYVQTEEYQTEEKAGKLIYGSYGRTPSGPIWKQLGLPMKNCANTSILALPDKLLALWEAGLPYALDLNTLETIGLDHLGDLAEDDPFGVHPKQDPQSGDIYNFGVTYGRKGTLQLYCSDKTGKIKQKGTVTLDGLPLIHDFVLAGDYLVFFIPPVRLNPLPFLTKRKSFSESLSWQPNKGTQILVINRHDFSVVSQNTVDPWFQWRFGNSYIDQTGAIVLEMIRYDDFSINEFLKEVASGVTQTFAKGTLWQIRLNPKTAEILQKTELIDRCCEFPTFNPSEFGKASRFTYLSLHKMGVDITKELFGTIACYDYQTKSLTEAVIGKNCYPSGPVYAVNPENPETGWILTVVFDANNNNSQVWVFDAAQLEHPVCQLMLPNVVPFSFHGTWKGSDA